MTALTVVANTYEIPAGATQFSLTLAISALTGILIGPMFGFVAGFWGDVLGFLYNPKGDYLLAMSFSMGLVALVAGFIVNWISVEGKAWFLYVKLALVAIVTFLLCTVAINTTVLWQRYSKTDYWTYLIARLFAQGQIWNSLVNYAFLFVVVPMLKRIKPLKIYVD
jgi:uncharacterized membrane protein